MVTSINTLGCSYLLQQLFFKLHCNSLVTLHFDNLFKINWGFLLPQNKADINRCIKKSSINHIELKTAAGKQCEKRKGRDRVAEGEVAVDVVGQKNVYPPLPTTPSSSHPWTPRRAPVLRPTAALR